MNIISARSLCISKQLVGDTLQHIIDNGGEGVILRKPKSLYEGGRSTSLIKLKVLNKWRVLSGMIGNSLVKFLL